MKMTLAIPYNRINSLGQYMSEGTVLSMLRRRGFTDNNIQVDRSVYKVYVFIDVLGIDEDGVIDFITEPDDDELFPQSPRG